MNKILEWLFGKEPETLLGVVEGEPDRLADAIEEWWLESAAAGVLNSPRGHSENLADYLRKSGVL